MRPPQQPQLLLEDLQSDFLVRFAAVVPSTFAPGALSLIYQVGETVPSGLARGLEGEAERTGAWQ